jgi:hypothetical protein
MSEAKTRFSTLEVVLTVIVTATAFVGEASARAFAQAFGSAGLPWLPKSSPRSPRVERQE